MNVKKTFFVTGYENVVTYQNNKVYKGFIINQYIITYILLDALVRGDQQLVLEHKLYI